MVRTVCGLVVRLHNFGQVGKGDAEMFRVGCRTCDPAAPHSTMHLPSCNSLFRPFATSGSGFLSEQTKQWKVDTVLS